MKNQKKHINIPIFVTHLGCPNMCVFCNQRSISGRIEFSRDKVINDIESVLSTVNTEEYEIELAFFGGSFTGIDRSLMKDLLAVGADYMRSGRIHSMRCSTRPDYIDDEILSILKSYGMRTIELGIQSMDDSVLSACKRGHTAQNTVDACKKITDAGFDLVGQMMIGLPGSDKNSEAACARFICECGAVAARVYPTVVFYGTELVGMCESGSYTPLTTEEAIERTASVLDIFDISDVPVIRVGLCSSENLTDDGQVYAGANDVAIGEMAMSALYFDRICSEIDRKYSETSGRGCTVYTACGNISKAVGHRRKNKDALLKKYGFKSVKILEKCELIGYNIIIDIN